MLKMHQGLLAAIWAYFYWEGKERKQGRGEGKSPQPDFLATPSLPMILTLFDNLNIGV